MDNTITKQLYIDGQLFQTTAWERGMGKYVIALLRAYASAYGSDNITLIFNSNLELSKERMQQIENILPNAKIAKLNLLGLIGDVDAGKKQATKILDEYLQIRHSKEDVDFVILNLFTFDYCAAFPTTARKVLMMYDLVPLEYWRGLSQLFGTLYLQHLATIFEADVIFSISEATKTALVSMLGINPERVVNIAGSLIETDQKAVAPQTKVPGKYFLSPTAQWPSKNNPNLVKAFSMLNQEFGNSLYLVLTSHFSDESRTELEALSENLIFCGAVSDEELNNLYANAKAIFYTSKAEGLGLPLFEAVVNDKPVVASDIEVLREVSKDAFYFANPDDPTAIYEAMVAAYTKENWEKKQSAYKKILEKFTWNRSAELFYEGLAKSASKKSQNDKNKLLIIMPSPSEINSALASGIQSAYGSLKTDFDVWFYTSTVYEDQSSNPLYLPYVAHLKKISDLKLHNKQFSSSLLYVIDNSAPSTEILRCALAHPGYLLLANNSLQKLFEQLVEEDALKAIFGTKPTNKDILSLLEVIGNVIVSHKFNSTKVSGWEFGEHLRKSLKA